MKKLNLPPFYVGQKVEYITGDSMPKGAIVIVTELIKKPCGCYLINFNGVCKNKPHQFGLFSCKSCRKIYEHGGIKHGWHASSFRAIQEQSYPLITFKEIQKTEKEEILILN